MKKRFMVSGVIVMILGVITWIFLREEEHGKKPDSPLPVAKEQPVAKQSDTIRPAADAEQQAGENKRTRPSQPPVERTYPKPKPEPMPFAKPLEGKPGFVMSPFNNKIVDVSGIPPGSLVADPTYPPEEKKYFRVPE